MELNSKHVVTPVGQRFLVRLIPDNEKIAGSRLVKPETAETKSRIGEIIAIGDGLQETSYTGKWPPDWAKIGGTVVFDRFAGHELPLEDVKEKEWPRIVGVEEVLGLVKR